MSQQHARGSVCAVIAVAGPQADVDECERSVRANAPASMTTLTVQASAGAVNDALQALAPADVLLISEPCRVTPGWSERMRDAALADSNTATASALADTGGALAVAREQTQPAARDLRELAATVATYTRRLRPRLRAACGPCVYLRREALELVGGLDPTLDLRSALESDFAERCLLSGLGHVAADDVIVQRLTAREGAPRALAESAVLALALEAAAGPREQIDVTIDARALDGAVTGTQVHILELILALARTEQLHLRVLVRTERIDHATFELLDSLETVEILAAEGLAPNTARSMIFHRPQQTFTADDVALALTLGERFVLSQLDLIAYRNPGYFADTDAWEDYRRASRHGLAAAERVVVFSDHTRRELLSDALAQDTRISVVQPGLDHGGTPQPRRPAGAEDAEGTTVSDGFLLCLGTDFRHKNRLFALRLLAALQNEHGWQGRLVLAGTHIPRGSSRELERAFVDEHPQLEPSITELGAVSEEEKAWLIAHAGAVVYPSVYEGFGLVPFESALSGVPCVFAAQSSLAEVAPAGTASILPWDATASAAAVHALLVDADVRAQHVRALAAAARELTWARAASALVEIYREATTAPVRDAGTLSRDLVEREARLSVEHELEAAQLVREREHAQRMYEELNAEVGSGLALIGPNGALPDGLQRALLALNARPALSRPLFAALSRAFLLGRALGRLGRGRTD